MDDGWIPTEQRYPDFTQYGFHTGRLLDVRYRDGNEERVIYQGYGLFGKDREDANRAGAIATARLLTIGAFYEKR